MRLLVESYGWTQGIAFEITKTDISFFQTRKQFLVRGVSFVIYNQRRSSIDNSDTIHKSTESIKSTMPMISNIYILSTNL